MELKPEHNQKNQVRVDLNKIINSYFSKNELSPFNAENKRSEDSTVRKDMQRLPTLEINVEGQQPYKSEKNQSNEFSIADERLDNLKKLLPREQFSIIKEFLRQGALASLQPDILTLISWDIWEQTAGQKLFTIGSTLQDIAIQYNPANQNILSITSSFSLTPGISGDRDSGAIMSQCEGTLICSYDLNFDPNASNTENAGNKITFKISDTDSKCYTIVPKQTIAYTDEVGAAILNLYGAFFKNDQDSINDQDSKNDQDSIRKYEQELQDLTGVNKEHQASRKASLVEKMTQLLEKIYQFLLVVAKVVLSLFQLERPTRLNDSQANISGIPKPIISEGGDNRRNLANGGKGSSDVNTTIYPPPPKPETGNPRPLGDAPHHGMD